MLKLKIENTHIDSRGGVSMKSGTAKEWSRNEQEGLLFLPNGEVRRVVLEVEAGKPLAVGDYVPADSAWYLDKFNEPKVSMRGRNWQPAKPVAVSKTA